MFTIIIPVYNEEHIIEANLKKISSYLGNRQYEIIVANNGSTDRTLAIAKKLARNQKRIKVISVENKAPGLAFKNAAKTAKGSILISQDMDLSTDLRFIDQALHLLKSNDLVVGSKRMGRQERSFLRKLPSEIFIFLTKTLLGLEYDDYSMAAKAYKRDFVLKHIDRLDDGTSYVVELIYFAKKAGQKIADIPVDCFDKRQSKFNIVNESIYRFNRLISLFVFRLLNR